MSVLTGVWQWDGRPVEASTLARLAANSADEGLQRPAVTTPAPGLALQVQLLHFDRFSALERQPHAFAQGSVLTWDGRLDNREELLVALHHDLGSDQSDAALVAAAYARWGTACLMRLIGDWSLALWDASSQTLVLARDYMGNRPLYYRTTTDGFAWATRLDALATGFGLYSQIDDAYVASRLMSQEVRRELTPFRSVRVVPSGHVLRATHGGNIHVSRHWAFEATTIKYRRATEYTDHLRDLLVEAVRVRLRADRTVWAHLSGGWDSSSVVCLAQALIQRGAVSAPRLQPVSIVSSGSPESDERAFIEAVERWCGLHSARWEYPGPELFTDWLGLRHPLAFPARFDAHALVAEAGDRVVLTGRLGDFVMLRSHHARRGAMMEALHYGPPWRFVSLLFAYAREHRRPVLLAFARMLWFCYAPERLKKTLLRRRAVSHRASQSGVSRHSVAEAFGVTPRVLAAVPRADADDDSFAVGFPRTKQPLITVLSHVVGRQGFQNDQTPMVRLTDPYAHRPLVEYMLSTPHLAFWHPGFQRTGMQRALTDILPPEILTRRSKGQTEAVLSRADRDWQDMLSDTRMLLGPAENWQLVQRDYLDRSMLSRVLAGSLPDGPLRDWIRLEAWLRTVTSLGSKSPTIDLATTISTDGARRPIGTSIVDQAQTERLRLTFGHSD